MYKSQLNVITDLQDYYPTISKIYTSLEMAEKLTIKMIENN